MKLTILHPTRHNGERFAAGDKLEVSTADGHALIAAGVAEPVDAKAEAEAEAEAAAEAEAEAKAKAPAGSKKS